MINETSLIKTPSYQQVYSSPRALMSALGIAQYMLSKFDGRVIIRAMIIDGIPYSISEKLKLSGVGGRAIRSLVDMLEQKLGVSVIYNADRFAFRRPELANTFAIARRLKEAGILTSIAPTYHFPDEPPMKLWGGVCGDSLSQPTGGGSFTSDQQALTATLAETLERYLWWHTSDYFRQPIEASTHDISKRLTILSPRRFCSFSDEQRTQNPSLQFDDTTPFLWIQGTSLVTGKKVHVPAQTVSGYRNHPILRKEPLIRFRSTIGLATWPQKNGAYLAGALEVIEREAYMVMWLNQLTPARISTVSLGTYSQTLSDLFAECKKYRIKLHVLRMPTDAPTHAICVIAEDMSGTDAAPRFAFGLKAHRSLVYAVEKAATEALRARGGFRRSLLNGKKRWDPQTSIHEIGHMDRIFYWAVPEHAHKLLFLTQGTEEKAKLEDWDTESEDQHLARIINWCKNSGFECVSVSLGTSKKNVTAWHVEMVLIPELQSTYLTDKIQHLGGERWKTVPKVLGYTPRKTPFTERPHPFA